ncbi:MAG: cysteine--tRNA ligase, partial [Bacteroidales bacterium]|nr:cysteine--tRNA ligase [Bacteroidales bacterium]
GVKYINSIADGTSKATSDDIAALKNLFNVFVFDILGLKKEENSSSDNDLTSKLMQIIIDMRQNAKSNKDWATSDKIRDELKAAGVQLKDTKEGVIWEVE